MRIHTFGSDTDEANLHVVGDVVEGNALVLDLVDTHLRSLVPRLEHLLVVGDFEKRQQRDTVAQVGLDVLDLEITLGEHRVEP